MRRLAVSVVLAALMVSGCSSSSADQTGEGAGAGIEEGSATTTTLTIRGGLSESDARCTQSARQAVASTHLPVLTDCTSLDQFLSAMRAVAPHLDSRASKMRLQVLCELTDVGLNGQPYDYSPLCDEAYAEE